MSQMIGWKKADKEIFKCVDCNKEILKRSEMRVSDIGSARCVGCHRAYMDAKYLDEGSSAVIKEQADRKEGEVSLNYLEQESELDKILEDY